ncbi:MAG: 4Fe-4S dicluster domain-containing protein [Kofleriaceae bacterium]|nr:4Fe-4S dicluster domain-containing protein [Kofleriaceae bacterium]
MSRTNDHHRLHVLPGDEPEFAAGVDEPPSELDRRELLKLLGAGAALATGALGGCMKEPTERIMPRVEQPPELVPGVPREYATAMALDGFATGLVVTTYEARPTKVEGNPDHPASLGATTAYHQASILELYDPNRPKAPERGTLPLSLEKLIHEIADRPPSPGLWFLLEPQSSPLVADLIGRVRARHRQARFAFYAPFERRQVYEGARTAFGRPLEAQYHFDRADVVVSLDADFTAAMPNSVRWARDFANRRRPTWPLRDMSRLYIAEPRISPTGSLADHRLAARASEIGVLAASLLAAVRGGGHPSEAALSAAQRRWVAAAAADLQAKRGRALVVVGDRQPAAVHALGHAINAALGAPVDYTEPAIIDPLGDGIQELAAAMRGGTVRTLVIVAANPVYTAPPELEFAKLLDGVPESFCVALAGNETARHCTTFVPLSHYMESWSDARAYDGTVSVIQPVIRPMHDSIGLPDLLAAFAGNAFPSAHDMLRERYAKAGQGWARVLQRGVVPDTAFPPQQAQVASGATNEVKPPAGGFELELEPSVAIYDGRFANNAWLQELPSPLEKMTWGNAAILSPATAKKLGVEQQQVVRLRIGERAVELPVFVMPGHADDCATVELGYGRKVVGPAGEGIGVDAYPLRPPGAGFASGVTVEKTSKHHELALTQEHFSQHERDIAPVVTQAFYKAHPNFTETLRGPQKTMLPTFFEEHPAWGMTIDTSICTGCSSCVVACQAENNIPSVGPSGVRDNREMHWLRIDTYREVHDDNVEVVHQPMACQHCENAPCEYVCPTYATQHSPDGLNEMVYNRCIGTRFCSNNCPYKVRRFNWFHYTKDTPKSLQLQRNPNVTVRARGVMEKCTYCVQRIRSADIEARKTDREIRPNEVVTACAQACPTGAIKFGLLSHTETEVVTLRKQPRAYAVLHDLGTRPRTMYLAKITNPKSGQGGNE